MNPPVSPPCCFHRKAGLTVLPLLLGAGIACAQTTAAPAARPVEATKVDSESAAAMERARRLADNPMRLILEASRGRARGVVTTSAVESAAVAAPAAAAAPPSVVTPATAAGAQNPTLPGTQQLRSELASTTAPAAEATTPTQISPTALPGAAAVPALPTLPNGPLPARLEVTVAPQLLRMVEPEIPQRVLDQVGISREVSVEFTIQADGSVAEVNVLPPASRQLLRFVADAVVQWRYAPLPAPRRMRVQLVFNSG